MEFCTNIALSMESKKDVIDILLNLKNVSISLKDKDGFDSAQSIWRGGCAC